jgi:hypothetical protein
MVVDLCCVCEAHMVIDGDNDDAIWTMVHRFAGAHLGCGFALPPTSSPDGEPTARIILGPEDQAAETAPGDTATLD